MEAADLKTRLVDAIRMLSRAQIIDHSGHGSARRDSTSFYINSGASTRSALTKDDVVVGSDIVESFALAAYLEENAHRQYMAMQIGDPYVFSDAEQQAFRERLWTANLFRKTWDHYHAKLERIPNS